MSSSLIYVHSVFSVKWRKPVLVKRHREHFFQHIRHHAMEKSIDLRRINGHDDHVHLLLKLNLQQSIANVMHILKGESAHWANQQCLFPETLTWAKGYYARSVDPDNINVVEHYIEGQSKHLPYYQFVQEFLNRERNKTCQA